MKTFSKSRNLLKSFYHYWINGIKAWQPNAGKNKGALIVLFLVIFGGLFVTAYMGSEPILFFWAMLILLALSLIDLVVYFLVSSLSKKYKVHKASLGDEEMIFFKKRSKKVIKYEDISELKYKAYLIRIIFVSTFFSFFDHFVLRLKTGEEILIPLNIEKVPLLLKRIKIKGDLKKVGTFTWEKIEDSNTNEEKERDEEEDRIAPIGSDDQISSKYLVLILIILTLYLIYHYLTL